MELSKKEIMVTILALTSQRDVEEAIDKNDPVFGGLYDKQYIKDLNLLIDKFENSYKQFN